MSVEKRARADAQPEGLSSEWFGSDEETSEDLAQGQIVIVTARWILVLAGLVLILWNPAPVRQLQVQIIVLFLLAFVNFYLHAQLLIRRPVIDRVVYGASAADIAVVTAIVLVGGGFPSNGFIFFYPAILAFSVSFPREITILFTGGAMLIYGTIAFLSLSPLEPQELIARLAMMAAVATCGNEYWRIERARRRATTATQAAFIAQTRAHRGRREAQA